MPQDYFNLNGRAALLAAIAAAYPVIGYTAPAAQVDFAIGNVTAVGANGQSRTLSKGAQIEQGDTVNTNGGRAQLRFSDGAYVSLQPESQFRIDQYRYDGKQDGNEKGFFSLLKGGLRTITGLVGRSNKANYQVSTSVATIGIRGTEYTIEYGHSITGTVGEGQIEVCNGGGCLSVTNGESYYVQGQEIKPVLTNKRTDLPPPPPEAPPQAFKQNDTVDSNGDPCALFPAQCGMQPAVLTGTIQAHVAVADAEFYTNVYPFTTATLDATGLLTSFNDFSSNPLVTTEGSFSSSGNDGIIAWGKVSGATGGECCEWFNSGEVVHYVVGTPADISALGGMRATYTLLGATQPTSTNTGAVAGTLNSLNMTADFLAGSNANVSGSMSWTLLNKPLSANFSGGTDGTAFYASGSTNFCGSVSLSGFFAGANASRAGIVYDVYDASIDSEDYFIGAAALRQTSLGPPPPLPPLAGTVTAHVGVAGDFSGYNVVEYTSATFDGSGLLSQFIDSSEATESVSGPVATSGNDGIIAWGRASSWTGGEGTLHYVAGVPADISQLGGLVGTYTLLGATQPTNNGSPAGTLDSMTMAANFLGGSSANVSGSMGWTLNSQSLSATFSGGTDGTRFYASGPTSFSGQVNLQGFFAGTNASRAGVVYSVQDFSIASGATFVGAAALKQTSLVTDLSQQQLRR